MNANLPISARWITDFEKQLYRRNHIILHGNIHDRFLWRGSYLSLKEFLPIYFQDLNFQTIVNYDPIDGFTFARPEMREEFDRLSRQRLRDRAGEPSPQPPSSPPTNAASPPRRANPGAVLQRQFNTRLSPEEAFAQLRSVATQTQSALAAIVDLGDMLVTDADRYPAEERPPLILLKKCTLEAEVIREGELDGYRNTFVILASDLKRVPPWFYLNNPSVAIVQVTHPDRDERRQFVIRFGEKGFFGGTEMNASQLETAASEFADLTEGFQTMNLEALRHTSLRERLPLRPGAVFRLVDFYKFGRRDEPFEKLDRDRVAGAKEELSRATVGQPRAVEAVTDMLVSAKIGISSSHVGGRSSKPKGIFFFVGPTGVGKTELAKSLTRLLFGDDRAFARFDMSEYKEEHAAEKLAGSPPGFVGYEEGGQLTNRVLERPYSILLFDEIEKAHPRVLDKFLQILEDGRLTDGRGQTAYFNQTVIIFTSNIGASDLSDPQTGAIVRQGIMEQVLAQGCENFTYEQVKDHFRKEVEWYFISRIGRAELLNRLGDSIVVFDLLRAEFVAQIGQKFLSQLAASAFEKHQLTLHFQPSVLEILATRMQEGNNLLFGGRRIKTLLENLVERPLNRWLFDNYSDVSVLSGVSLNIGLGHEGELIASQG